MNRDNLHISLSVRQPKAAVMIASALITLTSLLGACGGGSDATATPAPVPTQIPTTSASGTGSTSGTETTPAAGATTEANASAAGTTASNALTTTEQAAQTAGITAEGTTSGTANVALITSTQLITGTQVVTNVNVSTNTAVIEQQLITQVITNTNVVSHVVQNTQSSNAVATAFVTETAQLTPQSASGQAVANVEVTPLAPTPTPTIVVQLTRVVTATEVVTSTEAITAVATPLPNQTPQPAQGQVVTGISQVTNTAVYSGVVASQGKSMLLSTLLGSKFLTSDGAVSGKLDDVVIDMQSNQILYLMLTYGGFLNLGEKRVAVPLNAMSLKQDGTFLLNVPPSDLQNAPDLEDDWPQAGSPNWDTTVRDFWTKEGFAPGFDPAVSGARIRRVDNWIGSPLNDVGLGAGTVQDMIVALDQGRLPYVLVTFANAPAANGAANGAANTPAANGAANTPAANTTPTLGGATAGAAGTVGNDWYVIPLSAFDPQNPTLSLGSKINASTFEGAPRFTGANVGTNNGNNGSQNPFLPSNYDNDWRNFWNKLTTPNQ